MLFVPQIPKKVQFIFNFSFPLVRKLCKKTASEQFVGGRKGYDREFTFALLLKNRYGNLLNWQLKAVGRIFRKSIYNRRAAVERTFSMLKRKFHLGKEETRGILAFAKNVYLSLISYMLSLFDIAVSI